MVGLTRTALRFSLHSSLVSSRLTDSALPLRSPAAPPLPLTSSCAQRSLDGNPAHLSSTNTLSLSVGVGSALPLSTSLFPRTHPVLSLVFDEKNLYVYNYVVLLMFEIFKFQQYY